MFRRARGVFSYKWRVDPEMTAWVGEGGGGSDLVATVNCHSRSCLWYNSLQAPNKLLKLFEEYYKRKAQGGER